MWRGCLSRPLHTPQEELYRRADALSFVVEITAKGRDFF